MYIYKPLYYLTMKIRIKGNSLRYRLTKTDVDRFCKVGYLEERTSFLSNELIYALKLCKDEALSVDFANNTITLYMPQKFAKGWAETEVVGFENNNSDVYLLIEKDFKCLDNVAEDQSDNYPNPLLHNSDEGLKLI
jgi:hypothetical protein